MDYRNMKMIPISREQAEELFHGKNPGEAKIEQTTEELRLFFSLSKEQNLLVVYNTRQHTESFFLDNISPV